MCSDREEVLNTCGKSANIPNILRTIFSKTQLIVVNKKSGLGVSCMSPSGYGSIEAWFNILKVYSRAGNIPTTCQILINDKVEIFLNGAPDYFVRHFVRPSAGVKINFGEVNNTSTHAGKIRYDDILNTSN